MIKTIIIDDEARGISSLKILLQTHCPSISIIATCSQAEEATQLINDLKPDLVFLDISMPVKSGFDILNEIKQKTFEIIFVTAHAEYSLKAFKYSAADYLLKPVMEEQLMQAVERVEAKIKSKTDNNYFETLLHNLQHLQKPEEMKLCIPNVKGFEVVNLKDIIYCEAQSCYTTFHFQNRKKITVAKTIASYEELLQDTSFCRVHKSYLINIDFVLEYLRGDGGKVIMADGSEIEVARRKREHFTSRMKEKFKM